MATLGSLVIDLAANTARFQGDLGKAAAIAESRMRNIKDTAARALGAVTVAATAAGGALIAMFKTGVDRADDFRDMAQAVGITVESLSRLDFAAKQSGVATEGLKLGIQRLSVNIAEAAAKGGTAAAPFEALGIKLRGTNGEIKKADEILLEVANKFEGFEDGANKTALAVALFGRAGADLVPLLNQGANEIRALEEQSDKLGNTISGKTAAAADQFNDRMSLLGSVARGLQNNLAAALLPTLNALTEQYLNTTTAAESLDRATRIAAAGFRLLASGGVIVQTVFSAIGDAIGSLAAAVVAAVQGQFAQARDIIVAGTQDFLATTQSAATRLLNIWDSTAQTSEAKAPEQGRKLAAPMIEAVDAARKASRDFHDFAADFQRTQDQFNTRIVTDVNRIFTRQSAELNRRTGKDLTEMSEHAKQAARNIHDHFANFLFDPFQGGVKGMLKSFLDVLRRMVAEAAAAKIFDSRKSGGFGFGDLLGGLFSAVLGGGGSSRSIRTSGPLADGGSFSAGDVRVVGERGPELALFGKGGYMVPNHALGGGTAIHLSIYNDNRGASVELIRALPEHDRRLAEQIEARVVEGLQRRRYDV